MFNFRESNIGKKKKKSEKRRTILFRCLLYGVSISSFNKCNVIPIVKWETFHSGTNSIVLLLHLFVNANAKRFHIQCKLSFLAESCFTRTVSVDNWRCINVTGWISWKQFQARVYAYFSHLFGKSPLEILLKDSVIRYTHKLEEWN